MNKLQLRYEVHDDQLTLRPFIDGQDLLHGYRNDQGLDPHRLLPPISSVLLPVRAGNVAIIGVCSCGETGCGSLSVRLARIGSEVIWEPEPDPDYETVTRTYRFDLQQYLDAVDDAAGDPPWGEGRGRRVSRAVRLSLGLYDQAYESLAVFHTGTVDWVSAWPWTSDVVKVSITSDGQQEIYEFAAGLDETEAELAARVASEVQQRLLARG